MNTRRSFTVNSPYATAGDQSFVRTAYGSDSAMQCAPATVNPLSAVYRQTSTAPNTPMNGSLASFTGLAHSGMKLTAAPDASSQSLRVPTALSHQISPFGSSTNSPYADGAYGMPSNGGSPLSYNDAYGNSSPQGGYTAYGHTSYGHVSASPEAAQHMTMPPPSSAAARHNSASAFFSVGNMGPSTWQTMVPPAVCMAPSSLMPSAMSTPMHPIVALPEELPEADRSDTNLVIQHVPHHLVEANVHAAFDVFGEVTSAAIMRNIHTGESLGTAFVRFATHEQAQYAMSTFRRWVLECAWAAVPASRPRPECVRSVPSAGAMTSLPDFAHAAAAFDAVFGSAQTTHLTITWARRTHDDNTLTADERLRVRKLFIRNVPTSCTKKSLLRLFRKYGHVGHISIHRDNKSAAGKENQRHIAFVVYDDLGAAEKATAAIHNTTPFSECKGIRLMIKMTFDSNDNTAAAQDHPPRAQTATTASAKPTAREKKLAKQSRKERQSTAGAGTDKTSTHSTPQTPALPVVVAAALHASASVSPATPALDVHRALLEMTTTSSMEDAPKSSASVQEPTESRNLSLTTSTNKMVSLQSSQPTSAGEDALESASLRLKEMPSGFVSHSASASLPTGTVADAAGASSDLLTHTESSFAGSEKSRLGSDDFLWHAQLRSPVLGDSSRTRLDIYNIVPEPTGAPDFLCRRQLSTFSHGSAESPRRQATSTSESCPGIAVTVRRGGRVERVIYSADITTA